MYVFPIVLLILNRDQEGSGWVKAELTVYIDRSCMQVKRRTVATVTGWGGVVGGCAPD